MPGHLPCSSEGSRKQDDSNNSEQRRRCSNPFLGVIRCFSRKRRNGGTEGDRIDGLASFIARDEETATPWLPEPLHAGLASRLSRELFVKAGVRTGVDEDLDYYESAFEFAPSPDRCDRFSLFVEVVFSALWDAHHRQFVRSSF